MKKFIKGTFELDSGVYDIDEYERPKMDALRAIISWADDQDALLRFGTNETGDYLCEYRVTARTTALCKGYVSELRHLLKPYFPKVVMVYQASGDIIF